MRLMQFGEITMADKFNGFSQEDIKQINSKASKTVKSNVIKAPGIRRMPDKKELVKSQENVRTKKSDRPTSKSCKESFEESMDVINLDKSMSRSIEGALFYQPIPKTVETNKISSEDSSILNVPVENNSFDNSSILPEQTENAESPFKGVSLKDFEHHRKIIEEQNNQRKKLLYKAIEAHCQKTAAEAKKIEEIKAELAKLDNDLATDVALLRKQIDVACINYAHIEKQYNKIEAQFLKAKLDLHNASEKKELLTEHLCTVIAHNEDRKAQKLSELMHKVGLTPAGENVETNGVHKYDSL